MNPTDYQLKMILLVTIVLGLILSACSPPSIPLETLEQPTQQPTKPIEQTATSQPAGLTGQFMVSSMGQIEAARLQNDVDTAIQLIPLRNKIGAAVAMTNPELAVLDIKEIEAMVWKMTGTDSAGQPAEELAVLFGPGVVENSDDYFWLAGVDEQGNYVPFEAAAEQMTLLRLEPVQTEVGLGLQGNDGQEMLRVRNGGVEVRHPFSNQWAELDYKAMVPDSRGMKVLASIAPVVAPEGFPEEVAYGGWVDTTEGIRVYTDIKGIAVMVEVGGETRWAEDGVVVFDGVPKLWNKQTQEFEARQLMKIDGAWVEYVEQGVGTTVGPEGRYRGMVEVGEDGGRAFFRRLLWAWMQSRVNNPYFLEHFRVPLPGETWKKGEPETVIPEEVIDEVIRQLEARNYVMPAGLVWYQPTEVANTWVQLETMPEFVLDYVVLEVLAPEELVDRMIADEIGNLDTFSNSSYGANTYMIGLGADEAGWGRLKLTVTSAQNAGGFEVGYSVNRLDKKSPESLELVDKRFGFMVDGLGVNMQNARDINAAGYVSANDDVFGVDIDGREWILGVTEIWQDMRESTAIRNISNNIVWYKDDPWSISIWRFVRE